MEKHIVSLTEKDINGILKIQEKIIENLSNVFKWNELFFTNTKEEFLEILSNNFNLGKWLYTEDNKLIVYGFVVKDVTVYQWKTLLRYDSDKTAQIDIIAVNPDYWWKWYAKKFLPKLEQDYITKFKNIKTLLATVSPYNKPSLKLFLSNGYFIDGLFKKHNKYYRVIMRKDLTN